MAAKRKSLTEEEKEREITKLKAEIARDHEKLLAKQNLLKKLGASGKFMTPASGDLRDRPIGGVDYSINVADYEREDKTVYRKTGNIGVNVKREGTSGNDLSLKIKKIDAKKMFSGYKLAGKQ